MGREGVLFEQLPDEPVDVSKWRADDEFLVYPEGARDKSLIHSPAAPTYTFLVPEHRYLFKHSAARYPAQYWAEVIAYRLGCMLDVAVPPAFVAYDADNGNCGALIEWFLNYPGTPEERYVRGGDIMTSMISEYDRKKGEKHNFQHVWAYHETLFKRGELSDGWIEYWCDMLLFDALIGNTDRHQDNWGLLWQQGEGGKAVVRPAPVFDNGTSLGHEIVEGKLSLFADIDRLAHYVERGRHHMRWRMNDPKPQPHVELLVRLIAFHLPLIERIGMRLAAFNIDAFSTMLEALTRFDVPVPLSSERAEFIIRLTEFRYQNLMNHLVDD